MKLQVISLALLLAASSGVFAQDKANQYFWGKQDVYLTNQTNRTLTLVDELLETYKPTKEKPELARKSALMLLDGVLHDTRLDGNPELTSFIDRRLNRVIADLDRPVKKGVRIYKLYNDGFIVKTKDATVAYDMYRGGKMADGSTLIPEATIQKMVDKCDALFLSHNHPDHVDPATVKMFTDQGKPVYAPDEILPKDPKVTHLRSNDIISKDIALNGKKFRLTILPGHQDQMQNNIHIITTPDGYTFAQTGDQYNKEDLAWISDVYKCIPAIDLLMLNCWANSLQQTIDGFNPKVVVFGHENELGHTIDHRESYWKSYDKLDAIRQPGCLMTWGECLEYK